MDDERAASPDSDWILRRGHGPVMATAVHSGHAVRASLAGHYALTPAERRREEDPLTDVLAWAGDDVFVARRSRFEVDLNRPEHEAVYLEPSDAWGLTVWHERPPEEEVARSLERRQRFYDMMGARLEEMIARHGRVLLLDLHTYNHRRDGPDAPPQPQADNPDIDLGLTTADKGRFGDTIGAVWKALAAHEIGGERRDVRENVRFPDGGWWPEWVADRYGEDVCTVTLEIKKFFMDEWTGTADLGMLEDLRRAVEAAAHAARGTLR